LAQQLKDSTHPNLWDTCPPFQIDGNFGATAGISEMLVQSHSGFIDILPALPRNWSTGEARGLRARGDVTVDIRWSGARARSIGLIAGHAGRITIRSTIFIGRFKVIDDHTRAPIATGGNGTLRTFFVSPGHRYAVTVVRGDSMGRGGSNGNKVGSDIRSQE